MVMRRSFPFTSFQDCVHLHIYHFHQAIESGFQLCRKQIRPRRISGPGNVCERAPSIICWCTLASVSRGLELIKQDIAKRSAAKTSRV